MNRMREFKAGQQKSCESRLRSLWLLALSGMLLLSLAVLAWGLHDKLSLYTPPHAQPVSAKAKLLSEQERPRTELSATSLPEAFPPAFHVLTESSASTMLLAISLLLLPPASAGRSADDLFAPQPTLRLCPNADRRPPPAFA